MVSWRGAVDSRLRFGQASMLLLRRDMGLAPGVSYESSLHQGHPTITRHSDDPR